MGDDKEGMNDLSPLHLVLINQFKMVQLQLSEESFNSLKDTKAASLRDQYYC